MFQKLNLFPSSGKGKEGEGREGRTAVNIFAISKKLVRSIKMRMNGKTNAVKFYSTRARNGEE
jgi:hypothetical protein